MPEQTTVQPAAAQNSESAPAKEGAASPAGDAPQATKEASAGSDAKTPADATTDATKKAEGEKSTEADSAAPTEKMSGNSADDDVEMKDQPAETDSKPEVEKSAEDKDATAAETPAGDKTKGRRKSTGPADKGKQLKKKASKAKIQHLDAKPGDHYFAKLKGFPPWPVVVCEEEMLPQNMLVSRPVTAARPDGTYRDEFKDGNRRAGDRTFPVMYLHTNEFSWTPNTDLSELDAGTVKDLITGKMRKDLQAAHVLAAEAHDLDYYKNVLREFEEARLAKLEAKAAKAKTPKKSKAVDPDGDMDVADDDEIQNSEKKSKAKKRKAEEGAETPARSSSVKKPKIKLTSSSTPKAANGTETPKSGKDSTKVKVKSKPAKGSKDADGKKADTPKEPELTPEEKRMRKEKEILFLRHRLQKGLLVKENEERKEEEMPSMSEYLGKLETFPDLEVSIIRVTKINKVLKAIIKLDSIPKEAELQFKPRSQSLLDKWNKILAADASAAPANGVNGTSGDAGKKETANGVKGKSEEAKAEAKEAKESTPKDKAASEDKEATEEAKPTTTETPAAAETSA